MIETKAEGGYVVAPPTDGYSYLNGDLFYIPEILTEERDILISICKSFDQIQNLESSSKNYIVKNDNTPWREYNEKSDINILLSNHGWIEVKKRGDKTFWKRPGETDTAYSGNYHHGYKTLRIFTSSSVFDTEHSYSPVEVFALLELGMDHNNIDWSVLAKKLIDSGYGSGYSNNKNKAEIITLPEQVNKPKEITEDYIKRLELFRIKSNSIIDQPTPVITIQKQIISTDSALTVIAGQAKSAKTSVGNAIITGACLNEHNNEFDLLGINVEPNKNNKLVLHIDTEQTSHNQLKFIKTLIKRGRLNSDPDFFHSYNLRSLSVKDRLEAVKDILKIYANQYNGVYVIFIDGIADFVNSVNDETESNNIIHEFELLAIEYKCPLITILHYNPGSDIKGRGHIGSQLERKCESFLSISKKGDISTIEGKLLRNGGLFHPIEFSYNSVAEMHTLIGIKDPSLERIEINRERFEMAKTFLKSGPKSRAALVIDFMNAEGIQTRSAQSRVSQLLKDLIIEYNDKKTQLSLCATVQK